MQRQYKIFAVGRDSHRQLLVEMEQDFCATTTVRMPAFDRGTPRRKYLDSVELLMSVAPIAQCVLQRNADSGCDHTLLNMRQERFLTDVTIVVGIFARFIISGAF